MMDSLLQLAPPWLMIVPLVGMINASLFFILIGRRPISLPIYAIVAIIGALFVQSMSFVKPGEPPLSLGEVNLVATTIGAWVTLVMVRSVGL
jgi:hypothetical protein